MSTETYLAYDYPLLSMFWTLLWFFLWIMWFILLFRIIGDIFRDDGLSGWGKTGWLVLVIVLPFLGVFIYLIARGRGMGRREIDHARAQQAEFEAYIKQTAGESGRRTSADELAKLSDMRRAGTSRTRSSAAPRSSSSAAPAHRARPAPSPHRRPTEHGQGQGSETDMTATPTSREHTAKYAWAAGLMLFAAVMLTLVGLLDIFRGIMRSPRTRSSSPHATTSSSSTSPAGAGSTSSWESWP